MQDKLENLRAKLPRQTPIFLIIIGLIVVSVVIVLLFAFRDPRTEEEKQIDELTYDVTDIDETLSDTLSSAVNNDPNKDYQTNFSETKYFNLTAEALCSTLHISCANIMNQKLSKLTALNSNILNYYLDQENIVIISSSSKTTVIYGALYSIPSYITFTTDQTEFNSYTYASRIDLFNHLTGTESFYTLKP